MRNRLYLVGGVLLVAALAWLLSMSSARPKGRMPRIAAGVKHLLVIKSDGSLWGLGEEPPAALTRGVSIGTVGDGTARNRRRLVRLGRDCDWAEVAAGSWFSLALKTNGTLWAWGWNEGGQLGDGSTQNRLQPVQIGHDRDWAKIGAGGEHGLALKSDGSLWAWGRNSDGQLGIGLTGMVYFSAGRIAGTRRPDSQSEEGPTAACPTQVGHERDWREIAASREYSLALKTDGTLWAWGRLSYYPDTRPGSNVGRPTRFGLASDWRVISAGWGYPAGVRGDACLWTLDRSLKPIHAEEENGGSVTGVVWDSGLASLAGFDRFAAVSAAKKIGGSEPWETVTGGGHHALAIRSDGSLWAWGNNEFGQLGNGTTNKAEAPVRIGRANDWVCAAAGGAFSVAVRSDGSLWVWGLRLGGESPGMTWLRSTIAKYKIPIKLRPAPTMVDLAPVKTAELGRIDSRSIGHLASKAILNLGPEAAAKAGVKKPSP